MEKTTSRYTYVTFANEVTHVVQLAHAHGLIDLTQAERMTDKAQALTATQTKKAEYNKTNPKKAAPKGASAETQKKVALIAPLLSADNPMTAADINAALGTDFTALQVANACKFVEGATSVKVIRDTVNAKGLQAQKEYTAYKLEG